MLALSPDMVCKISFSFSEISPDFNRSALEFSKLEGSFGGTRFFEERGNFSLSWTCDDHLVYFPNLGLLSLMNGISTFSIYENVLKIISK